MKERKRTFSSHHLSWPLVTCWYVYFHTTLVPTVSSSLAPSPLPQLLSYLSLCSSVFSSLSLCHQTEMFPSLSPFSRGHPFNSQSPWSNSHLMKQLETRSPSSLILPVKPNTFFFNSEYHWSLLVLHVSFRNAFGYK